MSCLIRKPLAGMIVAVISAGLFFTDITAASGSSSVLNPGIESPFVNVVREVRDSVVYIAGVHEAEAKASSYYFQEKIKYPASGSGFIFRKTGRKIYILTNHHVIKTAKTIEVTLADQTQWMADVVGSDPKTDLAVISINTDHPVKMAQIGNSDNVRVGEWAIAIGNPLPKQKNGNLVNVHEQSVTVGVVSAKHRAHLEFGKNNETPLYQDYIQTDAPLNGGNSGGPLFDIHGQVIGVNAAGAFSSGGNTGIGFAIPANLAQRIADDLIRHGRVLRAYLGLVPQAITDDMRKALGLENLEGVIVTRISEDTPADRAGLERGDIIVRYGDKKVDDINKFRILTANSPVDKIVSIEVIRNGKRIRLQATPTEYAQHEMVRGASVPLSAYWLGIVVKGRENSPVSIVNIEAYTPADHSDLQKGDIILEINSVQVKDWDDYKKLAKDMKDKKNILFYIQRGEENLYIAVNNS